MTSHIIWHSLDMLLHSATVTKQLFMNVVANPPFIGLAQTTSSSSGQIMAWQFLTASVAKIAAKTENHIYNQWISFNKKPKVNHLPKNKTNKNFMIKLQ